MAIISATPHAVLQGNCLTVGLLGLTYHLRHTIILPYLNACQFSARKSYPLCGIGHKLVQHLERVSLLGFYKKKRRIYYGFVLLAGVILRLTGKAINRKGMDITPVARKTNRQSYRSRFYKLLLINISLTFRPSKKSTQGFFLLF